jgi:hypothetical protein
MEEYDLEKVPQGIRDWFGSEEVTKIISDINNLFAIKTRDNRQIVPRLLFLLELRKIQPENFANELNSAIQLSPDITKKILEEIIKKVLLPIKRHLLNFGINIDLIRLNDSQTGNFNVSHGAVTQSQTELKPSFMESVATPSGPRAKATPGEIIHPAPFVLHEEKSMEGVENSRQDFTTQRPTFYKPAFGFGESRFESYTKPKAATVELGGSIGTRKDLSSGSLKTSPQQVRVVHYSEFKTEVNPFGVESTIPTNLIPTTAPVAPNPVVTKAPKTPQTPNTPITPSPSIHPNNIVDLKDLPLK